MKIFKHHVVLFMSRGKMEGEINKWGSAGSDLSIAQKVLVKEGGSSSFDTHTTFQHCS